MSNGSTNYTSIYFDYKEYYSKTGERWISSKDRCCLYSLLFRALSKEEITYSMLVDRICKKIKIDEATTKMKLSYISVTAKPQREVHIFDDEDVLVFLTSVDEELRRSLLHVEAIKELEINQWGEQLSEIEGGSSFGANYGDMVSSGGRANDVSCDKSAAVDKSMDNDVDSSRMHGYVDLPHAVKRRQFVDAWEDGTSLELGQEYESKQEVRDIIDRASHEKCFGVSTVKSDSKLLAVKCREAKNGCDWYVHVEKVKKSACFSVRIYRKMHTCPRASASTSSNKRKGTRRLVPSILHEDYRDVKNWKKNIEQQHASDSVVNKILVGNKADMDDSKRAIPTSKGQALADEHEIKFFGRPQGIKITKQDANKSSSSSTTEKPAFFGYV